MIMKDRVEPTIHTVRVRTPEEVREGWAFEIAKMVLTLKSDTTEMSDADSLQIFLDLYGTPSTDDSVVLLRRLIQLLTPIGVQDAQQRQRVVIDNIAQSSLGTVQTVNSIASYNNVDARFPIIDQARNTFANGIRQNLTY